MSNIIDVNICKQYREDVESYSLYVNRRRAIPDARDGLKPVQRRIIWAAYNDTKCITNRAKSSRLVGDVMGKYHPHGDAGIYNAMKPMTNWFEIYEPLLKGKGNWGSFQGFSQSASRYTETQLSKFAIDCVLGLVKDVKETVDWSETYNEETIEPDFLPTEVPLLLINGSYGIGYGMSISVPKHNLNEVIDATINHILHPEQPVLLVPDTCMPCDIIEADFENISKLGYGSYTVRGRIEIVKDEKHNKSSLIITSVPDLTYLDTIIDKLEKLVEKKQLPQIAKMVDQSIIDKTGENNGKDIMRYIIELRQGADPNYVKDIIYKNTKMEDTVSVNFEAILDNNPRRFSYTSYIDVFLDMRKSSKIRFYYNKLSKVNTKLHEIDAYVKLLESGKIDEVLNAIRGNKDKNDEELINYIINIIGVDKITPMQASYIINANIKKLSLYHLAKYRSLIEQLTSEKDFYIFKIKSEESITEEIIQELLDYKEKYGKPRNSQIISKSIANSIPQGKFKLVITENNFIKKLPVTSALGSFRDDKPMIIMPEVDNTENILLFTKECKVFKLPIHKIPLSTPQDNGTNIQMISNKLYGDIKSVMYEPALKDLNNKKAKFFICVISEFGFIKKMDIDDFLAVPLSGIIYSKLDKGDSVKLVTIIPQMCDIVLWNCTNKALRINSNEISHLKRSTKGVMTFSNTIENPVNMFSGMSIIKPNDTDLLVITGNGKINRLSIAALPTGKRNTTGVKVINIGKTDYIKYVLSVNENETLHIQTQANKYDIPVKDIVFGSSASAGQKMINKNENIIQCNIC